MSTTYKLTPTTPEAHLGFELEFTHPKGQAAMPAIQEGIKLLGLTDCCRVDWEAISYQHPDLGVEGFELVFLTTQDAWRQSDTRLDKLLLFLKGLDCTTDIRCGLHIHLDARKVSAHDLRDALKPHAKDLIARTSKYRRDNPRCYSPQGLWIRGRYKTLEVRYHEATFSMPKIEGFVGQLLRHTAPLYPVTP
jgi:hypothetical protein